MNHQGRMKRYQNMANCKPSASAVEDFQRPAYYQAGNMIRAQGRQMERKSVLEYVAEKYDIKTEVDVSG